MQACIDCSEILTSFRVPNMTCVGHVLQGSQCGERQNHAAAGRDAPVLGRTVLLSDSIAGTYGQVSTDKSFLCRVANVANDTNMPLQEVTYQYWFNGPDGVAAFATSSPMDLFELQCSDSTTGRLALTARQPSRIDQS